MHFFFCSRFGLQMSKFSAICNCLYIWKIFYVLYALFVLLCLSLSGVLRTAQRNFLGIVATPIQRDLHVSDVFFGLIAGPIFSFSSATSGIIVGRLSDVYSRKWIFVICSILCGVATSLHGLVSTDIHLLWCRVFLAVSTSGFTPISVSLLSDYFPEKFRGIALSALTFSSVVGSGVAFGFGLFVKLQTSNWKNLFFIMGLPSIFLGLFMIFFIWEPERGRYDKQERESNVKNKTSFISSLKFILSNSSLWFLNIGIGFCFMASNASLTWLPTFFYRVHNIPIDELSSYLSWTTTTGSIFGMT